MHLSAISLFELGQFLRIFLWIFLPIFVLTILITSYMHYHKRRKKKEQGIRVSPLAMGGDDETVLARVYSDAEARPEEGNTAYRGLLWLKEKYERERERSTAKYMELKEEHRLLKDKYEELEDRFRKGKGQEGVAESVATASGEIGAPAEEFIERSSLKDQLAEKNLQLVFLQNQLDQRISNYHQLEHQGREAKEKLAEWETRHPQTEELLNERQATIDRLRDQLQQETRKTADVRTKLESGGNLLLKIHQELDQLLTKDAANLPVTEAGGTNHITAWAESEDLAPALNHFAS